MAEWSDWYRREDPTALPEEVRAWVERFRQVPVGVAKRFDDRTYLLVTPPAICPEKVSIDFWPEDTRVEQNELIVTARFGCVSRNQETQPFALGSIPATDLPVRFHLQYWWLPAFKNPHNLEEVPLPAGSRGVLVEPASGATLGPQVRVSGFAAGLFGGDAVQAARLSDDRIGRALDRLFDADRAALLTEVVLAVAQRFALGLQQLHNDSTSISLCGQYPRARGRRVRARSAPAITYGYSKDHRPDLEQLLFILTTAADGGVPVQFRCADGNTTDVLTHVQTWDSLRALAGRADFLCVADSKLCSHDNMTHIARAGGRFGVTPGLLPRIVLSGG